MLNENPQHGNINDIEKYINFLSTTNQEAFEALVAYGEEAIPALTKRLSSKDESERTLLFTLAILGELPPAVLPTCDLLDFLKTGPSYEATVMLAHAFQPVAKSVLPQLTELLKHEDSVVRRATAEVIGHLEPQSASNAAPTLIDILSKAEITQTLEHIAVMRAVHNIGEKAEKEIPDEKIDVYRDLVNSSFLTDLEFCTNQTQFSDTTSAGSSIGSNPPPAFCNDEFWRKLLPWKCP